MTLDKVVDAFWYVNAGVGHVLKPVWWLDAQVLAVYSAMAKKARINTGSSKYLVGEVLDLVHVALAASFINASTAYPVLATFLVAYPDFLYGFTGVMRSWGMSRGVSATELGKVPHYISILNKHLRLPLLAAGTLMVLASAATGVSSGLTENSIDAIGYGISLLPLASSMYIKEV